MLSVNALDCTICYRIQYNTNDNNKLNFSRVTTLSTPANSQPVISANKLGISSVPLTTRAQSHYTSNNNTPSKTGNKLNNALDSTTKKGRHRQLASMVPVVAGEVGVYTGDAP